VRIKSLRDVITFDSLSLFSITNMAKAAPDKNAFLPTDEMVVLLREIADERSLGPILQAPPDIRRALFARGLKIRVKIAWMFLTDGLAVGQIANEEIAGLLRGVVDRAYAERPTDIIYGRVALRHLWRARYQRHGDTEFGDLVLDAIAAHTGFDRDTIRAEVVGP
jgi:hypothetical protein